MSSQNSQTLLKIVPNLPPSIGGVGDYAPMLSQMGVQSFLQFVILVHGVSDGDAQF